MSERIFLASIPDTLIRPELPPMPQPYARIIGAGPVATEVRYDARLMPDHPQRVTTHELPVTEAFSRKFLAFWDSRQRKEWANCLSFASSMAGLTATDLDQSYSNGDYMFRHGESVSETEPLPLGAIGVIGNPVSGGDHEGYMSVHGYVGIGTDADQTLQVLANSDYSEGVRLALISPAQSYHYFRTVLADWAAWANDSLQARAYTPTLLSQD